MESIGILFVCTGNICRSPTVEAVFRHQVAEAGLEDRFKIDSAGTHGYHIGDPPDPRAIATALGRGVDMRGLKARKVRSDDFGSFHHVYAMDRGHHGLLTAFTPQSPFGELSLFLENADVPDPYYGTPQDFEDVYDLIEKGSAVLLGALKARYRL